jgi:hypothetical protein
MATYLQGVTDYIPQIQPFKPDLNFYQGVLDTKQAQYQAGYDKISNMYGTLLNSELSRGDNIERRDDFFNKIQTSIQKVSGLDLSRSENVSAAGKIFQPLIDDKFMLKDMSFTRTYRDEQGKSQYFLNCTDEKKCGGKYWDGGVRALDYQRADFVDASLEESLGFQNPTYTPYVDVYKKAMGFAKEMGFNIKTIDFTADGRYRVTTKNGPAMVTGLTEAFIRLSAGDPATTAMYNTQAYLQRKDYTYSNAEKFGGDKLAAEKEYLSNQAKIINQTMLSLKQQSEKQLKQIDNQQKAGDEISKKTPLNEEVDAAFINMLNGLPEETANAQAVGTMATESLNNTDGIDYQNMSVSALRQRIDAATANELLFNDMEGAATSYAMNTMEQEMTEDKYALANFEHGLRMSEIGYKASLDAAAKKKEKDAEDAEKAVMAQAFGADGIDVTGGQNATSENYDMEQKLETVFTENENTLSTLTDQREAKIKSALQVVANDPDKSESQRAVARDALEGLEKSSFSASNMFEDIENLGVGGMFKKYVESETNVQNNAENLIATSGNGLFIESPDLMTELSGMSQQIKDTRELVSAQRDVKLVNNRAVQNQMYIDGGDEIDIFFNEDGSKKSFSEFEKIYNQRHPTKAAWRNQAWWNAPAALASYAFVDSAADTYNDLNEQFKKTYNSGKVSLKTPYGAMGGEGEEGFAVKNKMYTLDPADVQVVTLEDGTKVLGGTREKIRELYKGDIARALADASFANNKVVFGGVGSLTSDDLDITVTDENSIKARKILDQTLRDAFTTQYKGTDANRPVMSVTRTAVVAGNPDQVGVTFKISDAYLKANSGSDTSAGFTKGIVGNEITVVMDRKDANSNFFKQLDGSPQEAIFNMKGSYTISSYEKTAGSITLSKNADGSILFNSNMKIYNPETKAFEAAQLSNGGLGAFDMLPGDADFDRLVLKANMMLQATGNDNLRTMRGLQ